MYWNPLETKIINLLKKRSPLTASEIANEISIHPKLLQIILNDLLMDSVIAVEDTDFGKRYRKQ